MGLKLIGEVALDGSGFERGLNKLGSAATHNFKNLVAGAFGVVSIHQAIAHTVESADELVTASKRLDLTVEQLQVMRQAAKESSVEFGKLETALDKINLARSKAQAGDAKMIAAFARLGVSQEDLGSKTAGDIFSGPMAANAKRTSVEDLTAAGSAIFGIRNFGALVPILKTDFEELQDKMEKLGSIVSTQTAVQVKVLADEFGLLSNIIVSQLAPALGMLGPGLLKFWGQLQRTGTFLVASAGQGGILSDLARKFRFGWTGAGGGTDSLKKSWTNVMDQTKETTDEQTNLQKAFGNSIAEMVEKLLHPPVPKDIDPAVKKARHQAQPDSDALISVGNFLGAGAGAIQSIAEQHLAVARETLAVQKQLLTSMTEGVRGSAWMDDTEFPE